MSEIGNLGDTAHFAELTVARNIPGLGWKSPAQRKATALANLGLNTIASGQGTTITAGTVAPSQVVVADANRGIGGAWIDTRTLQVYAQAAAGTLNATGTLTAALMIGQLVTSTTAAAVTATLDTGTLFETALVAAVPGVTASTNPWGEFSVVNTGPNAFTIATAAGWTDGGNAFTAVAAGTSARFGWRRTGANAYTIFKIS
jgi:hypothetical protein